MELVSPYSRQSVGRVSFYIAGVIGRFSTGRATTSVVSGRALDLVDTCFASVVGIQKPRRHVVAAAGINLHRDGVKDIEPEDLDLELAVFPVEHHFGEAADAENLA